jgi:SMODS-associating 2TM, beta-strand rich effector domain
VKIDLSKTSHILFFVVFLPAIALGMGWAIARALPALPFWVETISPLGAYGLLYAFFERVAWHWPMFRALGIVQAPDLRGRWTGEQLSSYKDANGKPVTSYAVLEIQQTFTGITTKTYYHRWNGSHSASCFLHIDGELYLVIIFESEPGVRHDGSDKAHKGVARLCYRHDENLITGTYFNSNGNFGELKLKRKSRRLLHRFAP